MKTIGSSFNKQQGRVVYFDYLRVFATFAVMILHISSTNWYTADVNGLQWQTFNFYDSIVRWGVPVFVMISGSLFLNRDVPVKTIYSKYIFRMAASFCVWSVIYSFFVHGSATKKIAAIVQGHYHMWFILMIIGLYMCIPLIKPILQSDARIKYFLILSFIFAFFIPETVTIVGDFGNELFIKGVNAVNGNVHNMYMHFVLGYVGYFVLGYYLNQISLSRNQRIAIYVLGLVGFIFTIEMDLLVALRTQMQCSNYYNNFTVNVLFEAIAVFTWFKYRHFENNSTNWFIQKLSKYSFGAYLIHALIIEQLNALFGLNTLSFNPILSVLCIGVITFVLSFGVSALLNHIPVVKKYLV